MNKTAKKVVATILTTVMTVGAATVVSADDLSITLSHQPYSHALPSYIGEEEGIFEENGLNTEILWFSSGNTQNEALGANEWDAGACGTPPAIAAGIAYNAKIVGFSVDDTVSVDYWVRADSDIAAISGEVEGYPDILGNADTWKGKTILCPTQTSAHYMLIAICGSDMHFFQNGAIGTRKAPPDFILGHESAGTVIEVGKDVTTLKVGDRVALEPGVPCGKCQYCKSGKYNLCPDVHFLAAAKPPTNGALRNYFAYPAEWCFKLPDNVSTMEGTMLEPLSVGMHAAGRGGAELGKTALIIGVGTIGYMTMLACKAMGVSKIIVSDALENRLALALQHGADYAINVKNEDAVEKVMEYTDGEGCDIVFETAGSPVTLASTWKYVKTAGVIVNVGNASGEIPFVFGELARKEVDIRSVWRYRNIYPIAIEAVRTGKIDLKHIEPAMFPFEKSQEAFEYAFEHRSEVLKTIIQVTE